MKQFQKLWCGIDFDVVLIFEYQFLLGKKPQILECNPSLERQSSQIQGVRRFAETDRETERQDNYIKR